MLVPISSSIEIRGMLSGRQHLKALPLLRSMCLIGAICAVAFGVGLVLMVPDTVEPFWDRAALVLLCLLFYWVGKSDGVGISFFNKGVYALFYVFALHSIGSAYINGYHPIYGFVFVIIQQNVSMSFRSARHSIIFLTVCSFLFIVGLLSHPSVDPEVFPVQLILGVMSWVCGLLFVAFKTSFIRSIELNRDLLRSLVVKTENAIFITDIHGIIQDANPRASELFGYAKEEMVDRDFSALREVPLSQDELSEGISNLKNALFWNMEASLKKKDGVSFHGHISIGLVQTMGQQFCVCRVRDNTAKYIFQSEILKAKEEAEEALKVRSQFLATMSHEIRTPLNGVIGMASLLDQTQLSDRQKEYVDTIQKSGHSLMVLLNDILDYSRFENARITLERTDCDVRDSITEVCDLLRPHASAKGLSLDVLVGDLVPRQVMTDPFRIKQVLLNLVGNAIKFTDKGFVRVKCDAVEISGHSAMLRFAVEDSGIGIPREKHNLLFQPFSQVDASTVRKYGGTGLGLAICNQIIQLMGGEFRLESDAGKGTCFSFSFECDIVDEQGIKPEVADRSLYMDVRVLGDMKVLIAEDNQINQRVLSYMLDSLGMKADMVSNGREAVELSGNVDYDIIFMDVQMPEMDGVLAAEYIRSRHGHQPYIISMTANSSAGDRERCFSAGMNDFIPKPFDLSCVRQSVFNWYIRDHSDAA